MGISKVSTRWYIQHAASHVSALPSICSEAQVLFGDHAKPLSRTAAVFVVTRSTLSSHAEAANPSVCGQQAQRRGCHAEPLVQTHACMHALCMTADQADNVAAHGAHPQEPKPPRSCVRLTHSRYSRGTDSRDLLAGSAQHQGLCLCRHTHLVTFWLCMRSSHDLGGLAPTRMSGHDLAALIGMR